MSAQPNRAMAQTSEGDTLPARVLVVGGDAAVGAVVAALQQGARYAVATAHGASALTYAKTWRPDVILLDLTQEDPEDEAFARSYQTLSAPPAPLVVCDGTPGPAARLGPLSAACHLAAPMTPDAVRSALDAVLTEQRPRPAS